MKAMSKTELKKIVEFIWKTPTDEKLPFAQTAQAATDNGTISKNLPLQKADNNGAIPDKFQTEEEKESSSEMTLLRKLCFFLSLNIGIFYIVTLAWILPCRQEECSFTNYEWKLNFSDAVLTTNLATNNPNSLPHICFGYASNSSGYLTCVEVSSGKQIWRRRTDFIPRHIFCYAQKTFDGMPDCFLASNDIMEAFNASNGAVLWQHNMKTSNSDILRKVLPSGGLKAEDSLIVVFDHFILVLNVITGHHLCKTSIPCSDHIDIKTSPWIKSTNDSIWYFMCDYGDSTEVWTFSENDLLNVAENLNENITNFTDFHFLLSRDYYNGSMVLVSDVTITSDILALSWADTVSMVTTQAPFHRPRKTWERSFVDPLGLPLSITGIANGRFTGSNSNELAIVIQQEANAQIHILSSKNGATVTSIPLGKKQVVKMEKISRTQEENSDSLLIETLPGEISSHYKINISDPVPLEFLRSYMLIEFKDKKPITRIIFSSDSARDAVVCDFQNGKADLLLAIETYDGFTILNQPIFRNSKTDGPFCNQIDHFKGSVTL